MPTPPDFVAHPLATTYTREVPPFLPREALPAEDWEVRETLACFKAAVDHWNRCGVVAVLFWTARARAAAQLLQAQKQALRAVVSRSAGHQAALRRVVNAMPAENGGRELVAEVLGDLVRL